MREPADIGASTRPVASRDVAPAAARAASRRRPALASYGWIVVWITAAVPLLWWGMDYYVLPLSERPYSSMHESFKPSGVVGHGLGLLGTAFLAIGVVLYSSRKRVRAFERLGTLRAWLRFHIFLCTMGPFLVLLHTTFRFGGLVSIAFWSMVLVVASGIFGRYVYAHIPKGVNGRFRSMRALQEEQRELMREIESAGGVSRREIEALLDLPIQTSEAATVSGSGAALGSMLRFDVGYGRRLRQTERRLVAHGLSRTDAEILTDLLQRHRRLGLERAFLQPVQRLFKYWHAFHMPLSVIMLVIVVIHVVVAVVFGYGWIFST